MAFVPDFHGMKIPRWLALAGSYESRCFSRTSVAATMVDSADVLAMDASIQSKEEGKLFKLLSKGNVLRALCKHISDGKSIMKHDLINCIKDFRKYSRFQHAHEILRWMEKGEFSMSSSDYAIHLDIISKKDGITAAEAYFDRLPPSHKNKFTYGSLLHCYCERNMAESALTLFWNMEAAGLDNYMAYESLISLYMRLNEPEKVPPLVKGMKTKSIRRRPFTYNCWMSSCAQLNRMDAVEKIAREIEMDREAWRDWTTHSNLAAIYVKAKVFDKAESALGRMERLVPKDRRAYHFMITLYAGTSNLEAVNRVWFYLKSCFPMNNRSSLIMLQALVSLGSVDGFRRCFQEWESGCESYDLRIACVATKAFLSWGMLEDADQVFQVAATKTSGPFFRVRTLFAEFFLKRKEMGHALEHMEAAVLQGKAHKWLPDPDLVGKFFACLEEEKDIEGAERLRRALNMGRRRVR